MAISVEQIQSITGHGKVVSDGGDKVGDIGQVYLNDQTGDPAWVTVKTGLFGSAESFVPLDGARIEGDSVVVAFDKETIKEAPQVDADGSITPDEEQGLYRHYGLRSPADEGVGGDNQLRSGELGHAGDRDVVDDRGDLGERAVGSDRRDLDDGVDRADRVTGRGEATGGEGLVGRRAATGDDDSMTRSEERLKVDTQTHVAGRAVLRKYVVTEQVTQTIPVRREEVRLVREPISDDNRGGIVDDADVFGEDGDVFEVVLHQEVPVVQTETVAVERVKVRKQTITDQTTVSDDVQVEKLEVDDPNQRGRGDGTDGRRVADGDVTDRDTTSRDTADRDTTSRDTTDRSLTDRR